MKKRLFFDMDNVLVDFKSGLDKVDESTKAQYRAKTPDEKDRLDEIPGLFALMEPMEGAVDAVHELAKGYDVFILSTAPWNNPSAWSDKVEWVKKYFGEVFYKKMVITHRKDLCEGDYLIDDRGKNGTSDFKGEWIKFGSPYFPNWDAVTEYLLIRKNREKSKTILDNRNTYSWAAFIILLLCELVAILGVRQQNSAMLTSALFIKVLFFFLLIVVGWRHIKYLFLPNKKIFTKLMANAIAPSWLGGIYLLLFVVHLGWLTDGSLNYFQSDNNNFLPVSISVITSIIGIFELICFFPEGKQNKENANLAVFVSGISKLSTDTTTLDKKEIKVFSLYNLEPLVSMFNLVFKDQKINSNNVSKLLILSSEVHYVKDFFKDSLVELKEGELTIEDFSRIFGSNNIREKVRITDRNGKERTATCLLLEGLPGTKPNEDLVTLTEDGLRKIIRTAAVCKYPQMKELFNNLQIEFTRPCDYDSFEQCFEVLNVVVKKEDANKDVRLYFNLTPGTGIVGSLMTLFSIDKYRNLYFYAQNSSKEILPINKSRVPLENLLSQALDTE